MDSKEKLLRKVKKLLTLSKSNNPHEAARALKMAQKLMKEHNITQTDVDLCSVIDRAFGVESYFDCVWDKNWNFKRKVCFYGGNERPVVASYCFDVLLRQLLKARKAFNHTQNKHLKRATLIARADKFCEGWCRGVDRIVTNFALDHKEEDMLKQYQDKLDEKHNFTISSGRGAGNSRDNGQATYAGFKQGLQVQLNRGVNGQETIKIEGINYE